MPRATDPKYNLLANKPDDLDRYWLFDIDADEQKVQQYGVLKSFFVKTDEATDIEAILEFQSTGTKPNSILKFGADGEFHFYSDGTDLFVKGTNATGKLRFYANSAEVLTLDPVADSIATYGNVINNDGTAGEGMEFGGGNVVTFHQAAIFDAIIRANGGIDLTDNNISYTGADGTGVEFDVSNNTLIKQILNCEDNVNVTGQINANKTGDYSLNADGVIRTADKYQWGANAGITTSSYFVTNLRWDGATLEMFRRNMSIGGGIIYTLSTGSWVSVL